VVFVTNDLISLFSGEVGILMMMADIAVTMMMMTIMTGLLVMKHKL